MNVSVKEWCRKTTDIREREVQVVCDDPDVATVSPTPTNDEPERKQHGQHLGQLTVVMTEKTIRSTLRGCHFVADLPTVFNMMTRTLSSSLAAEVRHKMHRGRNKVQEMGPVVFSMFSAADIPIEGNLDVYRSTRQEYDRHVRDQRDVRERRRDSTV